MTFDFSKGGIMGPADKELLFLHETSVGNKLFGNDFSGMIKGIPGG